ncbi:hypothetical protein HMPREF0063_12704 [Aeromicrobium marinum DSM 15272]|uniref:Uncharacterized protein n=1 Tax=Aeromicrobium marinum DSM 15272 TaxID=585531 RepID=E2SF95_9ACTN|nr:hypothetical protein [Aeromicrobium marinum]EFQ82180.1 hypothetical protein HMPREF0063_12704 [Aeromicrobium marinum DSM 15272]
MRMHWTFMIVAALLAAGGCTPGRDDPTPAYTPIPDEQLYAQILAVPGIQSVDIAYVDTLENLYAGKVAIAPDADAQEVLDRAHAILRQGRADADINLVGVQDGRQVRFEDLDVGTRAELEQRYGPQPGDGTPPGD